MDSISEEYGVDLAQSGRGVKVREVPLERIADSVTPRTTLVAVSAVQSADGRVIDLDALHAATETTGTKVLLDTTQAVGWLPVDASRFAYTACGGYKWLLSPRGTAYFTLRPELIDDLVPHTAGWYAGQSPWTSIYGGPLRLAADAGRFDVMLPAHRSGSSARASLSKAATIEAPILKRSAANWRHGDRWMRLLCAINTASSPCPARSLRRATISSAASAGIAAGLVWGRRDRGSNAASPSAR